MRLSILAGAACALLIMTGCAEAAETASLASTKPAAQLLRNSAAGMIPRDAIAFRESDSDESRSCSDDKDSSIRAWQASVRMILESTFAAESEAIATDIVTHFVSVGWNSERSVDGATTRWAMAKDDTVTTVVIAAVGDPDGNGKGATIYIAATGPCVDTDGVDSDEVRELEGR